MEKGKPSFRLIWGALMSLAYIGIAYLVLFTPMLIRYNENNDRGNDKNLLIRIALGVIMLAYGVMRGYRTYKSTTGSASLMNNNNCDE
jgi:cytochrome c oxidase assembly factor CtaG